MSDYLLQHGTRGPTSQRAKAPLTDQVPNSEGGYVWEVDKWTQLRRFLILGSEGGSYYAGEKKLTNMNVESLRACIKEDGIATVDEIVAISDGGRAASNDPALYALAACISIGDLPTRRAARAALPKVARIGTHLFHFAAYAETMRGWGKALRGAVADWYEEKPADRLAYDVVKYRQRDGWSHRDLLRLAHPATVDSSHARLYDFVAHGTWDELVTTDMPIVEGFIKAQIAGDAAETAKLIRQYNLPREALQTEHLNDVEVWKAMLDRGMPTMALTRNLATMTRNGILADSHYRQVVVDALTNEEQIRRSRMHPYSILLAQATYSSGRGFRGGNTWTPVDKITDALDEAFYLAFGNVQPTGKRILLALDVSGSMSHPIMDGPLTCAQGSAAMAMITGAVEADVQCVTFSHGPGPSWQYDGKKTGRWASFPNALQPFSISKRRRLDDVYNEAFRRTMGGTDCALPMLYASDAGLDFDAFVVYTDSETWAGAIHPFQALKEYRRQRVADAKLVVVGMVPNKFSIADPSDAGMMDVVGFDTGAPNMISEFIAGRL